MKNKIMVILAAWSALMISPAAANFTELEEIESDLMQEEMERRQLEQLEHVQRHAQVKRMQQQKMEQQRAAQQRRMEERRQVRYEQDENTYSRSKSGLKEEKESTGAEKPYFHYVY